MPSFVHHGNHQTVNHYHNSYHDREPLPLHHEGSAPPPLRTTSPKYTRIIQPSNHSTPSVKSSHYKVCIRRPDPYGDDIYLWASSELPWWFTDRALGHGSSRAAAAHESMLHDLRIEELRTNLDSAFHRLQPTQERWERFNDQWQGALGEQREWGVINDVDWARGTWEDNGGIKVKKRRGELAMVKRKKKSAEKDVRKGRGKDCFGFI